MEIFKIDSKEFLDKLTSLRDKNYKIYDLTYALGNNLYPSTINRILSNGVILSEYPNDKSVYIRPV